MFKSLLLLLILGVAFGEFSDVNIEQEPDMQSNTGAITAPVPKPFQIRAKRAIPYQSANWAPVAYASPPYGQAYAYSAPVKRAVKPLPYGQTYVAPVAKRAAPVPVGYSVPTNGRAYAAPVLAKRAVKQATPTRVYYAPVAYN